MKPKDLATQSQVYLERLKSGFASSWLGAQRELRRNIRNVLTALEVESLSELNRNQLNSLLVQLQFAHTKASVAGMARFSSQLYSVAQFAGMLEAQHMNALLPGARFSAPTAKLAYKRALDAPIQATGALLSDFVDKWPENDAKRVNAVVRTGWAQGKTVSAMVREVIGTRKEGYTNGILEISRRHASTVMHTATQHVATQARLEMFEENNDLITGYEWVSTLDRRTTQQCQSLDGQKFEAGKGPLPPIHPNCRSTISPTLSPEFDYLDEGATRASGGENPGQVDAKETFHSWLKKQPEEFQDLAVGKTRGKLLRDGGLTSEQFRALNIDKNFAPATLKTMREINPQAFIKAQL